MARHLGRRIVKISPFPRGKRRASGRELLDGANALLTAVYDGSSGFTTGFSASLEAWLSAYNRAVGLLPKDD